MINDNGTLIQDIWEFNVFLQGNGQYSNSIDLLNGSFETLMSINFYSDQIEAEIYKDNLYRPMKAVGFKKDYVNNGILVYKVDHQYNNKEKAKFISRIRQELLKEKLSDDIKEKLDVSYYNV